MTRVISADISRTNVVLQQTVIIEWDDSTLGEPTEDSVRSYLNGIGGVNPIYDVIDDDILDSGSVVDVDVFDRGENDD